MMIEGPDASVEEGSVPICQDEKNRVEALLVAKDVDQSEWLP